MNTKKGYFGEFGGRYVSEDLIHVLDRLADAFNNCMNDPGFGKELAGILKNFVGRPTPLLYAENATRILGGAKIYLKMECLANTGAHKINNAVEQALLAKSMGKKRIIAETGAGQHGIATACICAKLGLDCAIYMGSNDIERQKPNVFWMEMFGAKVIPVTGGTKTLTDAVDEAFRVWAENPEDIYYLIGSALGPYPYPDMVRTFQSIIGKEVKRQIFEYQDALPDVLIACVGGGSNAIGFFHEFINEDIQFVGVEAGGKGDLIGEHALRMTEGKGSIGCIQGYKSFFLHKDGALLPTHSISAGLDYAGIGPQLAYLGQINRIRFTKAYDREVMDAIKFFAENEGIIPALESAHALVEAIKLAPSMNSTESIVVNISGRGDKDLFITSKVMDKDRWFTFS